MTTFQYPEALNLSSTSYEPSPNSGLGNFPIAEPAVVSRIIERYRKDDEALLVNTLMALAIPARAHNADGDWRSDSRILKFGDREVLAQQTYLDGLSMLVLASWEQLIDDPEAPRTIFHKIATDIFDEFQGELTESQFALYLRETYEMRLESFCEHGLITSSADSANGTNTLQSEKLPQKLSAPPQVISANVSEFDLVRRERPADSFRTLACGLRFDVAFDYAVEKVALDKLKDMSRPVFEKSQSSSRPKTKFLHKRFSKRFDKRLVPDVFVKFATSSLEKFVIHCQTAEAGPTDESNHLIEWLLKYADQKRGELYGGKPV